MGNTHGAESIRNRIVEAQLSFRLVETRPSGWNTLRFPKADEVECLFRPEAALEAITVRNPREPGR
jgi:hypothetical protein